MKKGITLIEILVVIAIISVIAALSLPVYRKAKQRALIVKTLSIINSIEAALSMYSTDFGDYPHYEGEGTDFLVLLLQGPVDSHLWKGPYIRFKKEDLDNEGNILDAWKMQISYRYPQDKYSNVPYIIVSAGPDRKFDTTDDIGNW
ncbi:MAG: type II secretion system protein GspG [Candidatus Omnitrophica bacterium]|nr:type II secretion system protein GspG [Candidatus Omnitrophota bacterium]MCM8777734.1 type II secretion system protein GspG [Candidatus Omnitrophota bacterium]